MSEAEKESRKRIGLQLILRTIVYAFAVFGLIFIVILLGVLGIMSPSSKIAGIPDSSILTIDFDTNYAEIRSDDFFAEFSNKSVYSVTDLVRAIDLASGDSRIKAIAANIGTTPLGLAQIQDISRSLERFKSKGKKTYIFSSGMGTFGQGSKEYYLASFFDEIWLQPNSDIGLTGISIEVPFFKKILQKIGIEPEFYTRHEFKTAMSSLVNDGFTPEYRGELDRLGFGLFNELKTGISLNRKIEVTDLENLINNAPIFADEALEAGLVDRIGYQQQLAAELKKEYSAKYFSINDYMSNVSEYVGDTLPEIAIMVMEGVIESGESTNNPVNDAVIGSKTVLTQLEELRKRKNLKGIIVRINSPGGSYTASDEIWYALTELKKEKNIPIVVSMGNYAASGGYFISLAGDYILAEPATITGSIGVLGGKFVLAGLWKNLDIRWGEIKFGDNAGILSMNHKFSPAEKKVFNRSLDRIYSDFTAKVATARHIDAENMNAIARGRVWLGRDAVRLNLVDELGGPEMALEKAKTLSGIKSGEAYGLVYYPRRQSFQEKLTKFFENGGGLPSMQVFEQSGVDLKDLKLFYRLRHDAVLPPFRLEM